MHLLPSSNALPVAASVSVEQAVYASWRRQPLAWLALIALAALIIAEPALAQQQQQGGFPTMPLPSTTQDQNDLLNILWGWGRFLIKILLVLVGGALFIGTVAVGVRKYLEITSRDGSLGEILPVIGLGIIMLMISTGILAIGWRLLENTNITS